MDILKLSTDRKVTNSVTKSGNARMANAFGLPSGQPYSCPDATSFCSKICYAGKLERMYSNVKSVLLHNFEALQNASLTEMVDMLDHMLISFERECERKKANKAFRIHWDGDFFSVDYARAWAIVVRSHPDVSFWVYTRSFDTVNVLPYITGIPNLTVYLSADPVNIALANERAAQYPGVYIATVADTFADARDTIVDTARKTYPCPENRGSLPLITEKGSACIRCGICPSGRGDVLFSVGKK